ncbi:hypothetical protein L1276_000496 [Flavobacterium sp. HSC-32F16]|uniref:2TM domain-containing protein n=1 Tax=Flavobacterium sp. HSC-32F16 TaxID=2910964 RepID=UPI0020A47EF3|nr:2TM domain-containing protein [Flavobacterium sp. HSC-32F16]MCP2025356.1 hypothetical protein [Flavobacterium sp. HSC-32F16]
MRHLASEPTMAQINPKKGFKIHLFVFVLTVPVIWLTWFLTSRTYLWPLWQSGAWAIGLLFHYLGVFVFKKSKNNK